MSERQKCPVCKGRRYLLSKEFDEDFPCGTCRGRGYVEKDPIEEKPETIENPYIARAKVWVEQLEQIHRERGGVYGDPEENHRGIAMMWAPILQSHWEAIRLNEPLPPWVVCLLQVLVKINRMRLEPHEDNYVDALFYAAFAYEMQKQEEQCESAQDESG